MDGELTNTVGFCLTVTPMELVPAVVQPVTVPLKLTVISPAGVNVNVPPVVVPV